MKKRYREMRGRSGRIVCNDATVLRIISFVIRPTKDNCCAFVRSSDLYELRIRFVCACARARARVCVRACVRACVRVRVCMCMCTCIHVVPYTLLLHPKISYGPLYGTVKIVSRAKSRKRVQRDTKVGQVSI